MPRQQDLIDDNDPKVQYVGDWSSESLPGAHDGSAHGSTSSGEIATLTLNRGDSIEVFGVLNPGNGLSGATFELDGVTKTFRAPETTRQMYNVSFAKFKISSLSPLGTPPVLVITTLDGSKPSTFWLDYFVVESFPGGPISSQSSDTTSVALSSTTPTTSASSSVFVTLPSSQLTSSSFLSPVLSATSSIATSTVFGDETTHLPHTVSTLQSAGRSTDTVLINPGTQITSITTTDGSVPSSNSSGDARENLAQSGSHPNTAAIVGGVFACLLVIACVVIYALVRRNRRSRRDSDIIYPSDNDLAWNGNDMVAGEAWAGSKYPASPGMTEFSSPNIIPDAPPTQYGLTPMASNPFMERVHTKYS